MLVLKRKTTRARSPATSQKAQVQARKPKIRRLPKKVTRNAKLKQRLPSRRLKHKSQKN